MKKLFILASLLLCTSIVLSQDRHHEKIKALKVGYITEQLNLSPKEAQEFWPIYNAYDQKRSNFRDEERNLIRNEGSDIDNLTEKEASSLVLKLKALELTKDDAEQRYISDLQKTLSGKKILKLYRAEKDFRKKLLHRLRDEKSKGNRKPR